MNNETEWMSPEEMRQWLGVGRTKCYELISREEIPSYRIGKLHRIKKIDVERWLENHKSPEGDR